MEAAGVVKGGRGGWGWGGGAAAAEMHRLGLRHMPSDICVLPADGAYANRYRVWGGGRDAKDWRQGFRCLDPEDGEIFLWICVYERERERERERMRVC